MKNGIKIIIALFFIVCAFLLGKYFCVDDCKEEKNKLNEEVINLREQNKELQNSVNSCQEKQQDELNKQTTEKQQESLKKKVNSKKRIPY
jgi:hypothetical protein